MQEERFNPQEHDELSRIIVNRLAERQHKIEQMKNMEASQRSMRKYGGAVMLAIAACIVAIVVFKPFANVSALDEAGIGKPETAQFRNASREMTLISEYVDKADYDAAQQLTEKMMKRLEVGLDIYKDLPLEYDSEEMAYDMQNDMLTLSQLRWTYIYILVKQEKNKQAVKELKRYMKDKEYADHYDEAMKLLEILKN